MDDFFYCGCIRVSGHHMWRDEWNMVRIEPPDLPEAWCRGGWDSTEPRYEYRDGWSRVTAIDNTVDPRPGSHSTVLARGDHTAPQLWSMLADRFPGVYGRLVAGGVIADVRPRSP